MKLRFSPLSRLTAVTAATLAVSLTPRPTLADPPGGTAGWTLAFEDTFSGTSIDSTKWWRNPTYLDTNGIPQGTSAWPANGNTAAYPASNVTIVNGTAQLRSARENVTDSTGVAHAYSSAWMTTDGKFYATPGSYLECSFKVANTPGLDAAFWLNGKSHAWPPEVDIAEIPSAGSPGLKPGAGTTASMGNFYKDAAGNILANSGGYTLGTTQFQAGFHTFGLRWETDLLIYYVDGVERWRTTYKVPTEPCYLILSEELNNNSGWYGDPANGTYPTYGAVDWVRVWKTATPAAPTGLTATAGNGQVSLAWTASSSAISYNIYRGTTPGGESPTPIATGITDTSFLDNGLPNGAIYYYKVAAVNSAGTSANSNEASATPTGTLSKTYILTPIADDYIQDGSYINSNYGTVPWLNVKKDATGYNRRSYLKFDLSGVAGTINSAQLQVYGCLGSADSMTIGTHAVTNTTWTETGLAWSNAPVATATPISSQTVTNTAPGYVSWNVASHVAVNLGQPIGLALVSAATSTNGQVFNGNSREAIGNPPRLIIVTAPSVTTHTLSPVADTFVRDGSYATAIYGTTTPLVVKKDATGYNRKSYFKFDLTGLSGTVSSAKLRFYGGLSGTDTVTVGAYPVTDTTWTEATTNWNNAPALGTVLSSQAVTNTASQYLSWDVSSYISGKLGNILTLALSSPSISSGTQAFSGNSRESVSNTPELVIITY